MKIQSTISQKKFNNLNIQEMILNNKSNLRETVYVREKKDLLLLNYRPEVQYKGLWTPLELVCRGLIINRFTGEVVARPFDKFFNWGENNCITNAKIKQVSEKMDGSLGIHYRAKNEMLVTTRGSFDSDQAQWATEWLNTDYNIKNLPNEWTLLFEIIYPTNKIVIDYEGWSGLVLLAIRDRFTGNYMSHKITKTIAKKFGFRLPKQFYFSSSVDIIEEARTLPGNNEGWVAEFEDGQRFKFKGAEYVKLHKIINKFTFKLVLEHHKEGTIEQLKRALPDEFHKELNGWVLRIDRTIEAIPRCIEDTYREAPKSSRKEYALWVQKNVPKLSKYMFTKFDNKSLLPLIYKSAFN